MESPPRPEEPPAPGGRRWPIALGLAALALYAAPLASRVEAFQFDEAVFRPGALPIPFVVAVAAAILWLRWERLRSLPPRTGWPAAIGLGLLGCGLMLWARLTASPHLLLLALPVHGLALAAALRGGPGLRWALPPALVLMLGVRLPKPVEDELIWSLQTWTTSLAGWLLPRLGHAIEASGVMLHGGDHSFHVVDGCSGYSGISILLVVALLVRELFAEAGRRSWWLVAIAPWLGLALNVVRVSIIAASPDPEALAAADGDHTIQGLAVLMSGTAILYGLGWWLARGARAGEPGAAPAGGDRAVSSTGLGFAGAFVATALLYWALPVFPQADRMRPPARLDFPDRAEGWEQTEPPSLSVFNGVIAGGLYRRYRFAPDASPRLQVVDLTVAVDSRLAGELSRTLSSKLPYPGPDWTLLESEPLQLWILDREVELALLDQSGKRAVSYSWRPRDRGLLWESLYAWLAVDRSPWRRERPRAGVRVVAYAPHDGELALDRARQRLESFVRDFRDPLLAISADP